MRRLWVLMVAVLAFGAFAVAAPVAGAASNAKFCKAIAKIGNSSSSLSDTSNLQKESKKVAGEFRTAAKNAPTKVKKAMNYIASFISSLGTKNPADLAKVYSGDGFKKYTSAIGTYVKAATACETS